jgi:TonB family protein
MRRIRSGLLLLVAIPFVTAIASSEKEDEISNVANAKDTRVTFVRDSATDRQPAKTAFPKYPSIARRDRIEGEATVCFDIDVRGKVKHAKVKSYTHKIFKKPALRSARKSSFEPLRPNQVLARTKSCRIYRFRLDPIPAEETSQ